jgi:hypothetical protein
MKHHTEEELREVTNPIFEAGEKLGVLLPGIDPFSLFLSNLSSTRFCSFPSSDGILPVNPLEWKFLQEMNRAKSFLCSDTKGNVNPQTDSNKCKK